MGSAMGMGTDVATGMRLQSAFIGTALAVALCIAVIPAAAASDDGWKFRATIYGWFPDIEGQTKLSQATGGDSFKIDIGDILQNLEFTLQGGVDARKGRWGVATDLIYMSVGKSKSRRAQGTIGGTQIPTDVRAEVDFDMKSWIWTTAGYYRAHESGGSSLDLLAGARYTDVAQEIDWSLTGNVGSIPLQDRTGRRDTGLSNWDAIVGLRGRVAFGSGDAWFVPYYADIGAGESDLTYQLVTGLGYAFNWGEVSAVWRYLGYDLDDSSHVEDLNFNGPAVGATFRW